MTALLQRLRARLDAGGKLLVPYVMAGIPDERSFGPALQAVGASADAIEVGLPYSDPLVDGPVIAMAAERVLAAGTRPLAALDLGGSPPVAAPRLAMTYYNPIYRCGEPEFCRRAAAAGYTGLIVPDLPQEESRTLRAAAAAEGLAWVGLVAPTSPPERVEAICRSATGFVYAVSTLGVTGERARLSERAAAVVASCRAHTDLPVLIGFGVSTADHAVEAAAAGDGVIVGSAVVRLLSERGPEAAAEFVADLRSALDRVRAA